jgi:hypothetical protein
MRLTYRLRFFDLYWMYFGNRTLLYATSIGGVMLAFMCFALSYWADLPVAIGFIVGGPILGPVGYMIATGTASHLYSTVGLVIDDKGVRGWPAAPGIDRSWGRLDQARMRRSVLVLEFLWYGYGSRRGWVAVPLRAVDPARLEAFGALVRGHTGLAVNGGTAKVARSSHRSRIPWEEDVSGRRHR